MREPFLFITSLIILVTNLTMEYGTLTRRHRIAVHVIVRCVSLVILFCLVALLYRFALLYNYSMQSLITIPFYLSILVLFEESFAQKTFLYFMDFTLTFFLFSTCRGIMSMLPLGNFEYLSLLIFYGIITVVLLWLYFRLVRARVRAMLFFFRESNPLYALLPFLSFVFSTIFFNPMDRLNSFSGFMLMLLYISIVILVYYLLFSHFYVVYRRLQADSFIVRTEQQLALQKKYYEELNRGIEAQQKILHDTRHHLVAIASLAGTGNTNEIERYIEGLLDSYRPPDIKRYCANSAINAALGGYAKIAEEKGIAISIDVDFPERLDIDEYELCALIGNTFENAIEACDRISVESELYGERFIRVKSRITGQRLIIRVENSFQDNHEKVTTDLRSEKGSGIGLKSVRKVVDMHDGSMSCEKQENVFIFSAVLCLKKGVSLAE